MRPPLSTIFVGASWTIGHRPTVVHFAGHGGGQSGLCFETSDGGTQFVGAIPLTKLFHVFKDTLKCVVLNACYSEVQAQEIQREIDYVVGMRSAVGDAPASKFAVAFYDAVFAGTDFRTAFDLACTALDLNEMPDADVPVFMTGARLDSATLKYSAEIPEIERIIYAYLRSPYADRAKFTTTGESLAHTMIKHYGQRIHRSDYSAVRVKGIYPIDANHWRVSIQVIAGGEIESGIMYLHVDGRRIAIEWEASVGLWSMPPKTYLSLGYRGPVVARVRAELDDYYNFGFSEKKEEFLSVQLEARDSTRLHGYLRRFSPEYDSVVDLLSDGNPHEITVELLNLDTASTSTITRLLSPTWIYSNS